MTLHDNYTINYLINIIHRNTTVNVKKKILCVPASSERICLGNFLTASTTCKALCINIAQKQSLEVLPNSTSNLQWFFLSGKQRTSVTATTTKLSNDPFKRGLQKNSLSQINDRKVFFVHCTYTKSLKQTFVRCSFPQKIMCHQFW